MSHARKLLIGERQTYRPTVIHDTAEGTGAKGKPGLKGDFGRSKPHVFREVEAP
jgi:hypothetical protein